MFSDLIENSILSNRSFFRRNKVDPAHFSFLENGWWALHLASVAGIYYLGHSLGKKKSRHSHM